MESRYLIFLKHNTAENTLPGNNCGVVRRRYIQATEESAHMGLSYASIDHGFKKEKIKHLWLAMLIYIFSKQRIILNKYKIGIYLLVGKNIAYT